MQQSRLYSEYGFETTGSSYFGTIFVSGSIYDVTGATGSDGEILTISSGSPVWRPKGAAGGLTEWVAGVDYETGNSIYSDLGAFTALTSSTSAENNRPESSSVHWEPIAGTVKQITEGEVPTPVHSGQEYFDKASQSSYTAVPNGSILQWREENTGNSSVIYITSKEVETYLDSSRNVDQTTRALANAQNWTVSNTGGTLSGNILNITNGNDTSGHIWNSAASNQHQVNMEGVNGAKMTIDSINIVSGDPATTDPLAGFRLLGSTNGGQSFTTLIDESARTTAANGVFNIDPNFVGVEFDYFRLITLTAIDNNGNANGLFWPSLFTLDLIGQERVYVDYQEPWATSTSHPEYSTAAAVSAGTLAHVYFYGTQEIPVDLGRRAFADTTKWTGTFTGPLRGGSVLNLTDQNIFTTLSWNSGAGNNHQVNFQAVEGVFIRATGFSIDSGNGQDSLAGFKVFGSEDGGQTFIELVDEEARTGFATGFFTVPAEHQGRDFNYFRLVTYTAIDSAGNPNTGFWPIMNTWHVVGTQSEYIPRSTMFAKIRGSGTTGISRLSLNNGYTGTNTSVNGAWVKHL